VENRKLTLVKAKGRGAGARGEEIEKGEDGGRDGEGKTVAEEVGASGLVETLMVEGSTVTSGSLVHQRLGICFSSVAACRCRG